MRSEQILRELVALDTVSARSNDPAIEFAAALLAGHGWHLQRSRWLDAVGVPKSNLLVCSHETQSPELALVGHVDTVPSDPAWTDALELTERDGRLHGLGACDMKGFVASCLARLEALDRRALARPLMLILTADEEVGCLGAKRLATQGMVTPRRAVIGEPTGLIPVRAGKGYGLATLTVRGREAHSAFPARGHSAIFDSGRVLARLEAIGTELAEPVAPQYDPPHATLNVGLIRGGRAKNIVPGECELTVEFRPLGDADPAALGHRIAAALAPLRGEIEFDFHVTRTDPGFETPADAPFVGLMERLTGQTAGTVSFGTEAPYLAALGAQAIVCGPGDMTRAHRRDEYLTRDELAACDDLLARMVGDVCG